MRARLVLLASASLACVAPFGCNRDKPAFDDEGDSGGESFGSELPDDDGNGDGDGDPSVCEVEGGVDLAITVPQSCGETNDLTMTYERVFKLVEASGSTWSVNSCLLDPDLTECPPEDCLIAGDCYDCGDAVGGLIIEPLPVADLANPGTCLQVAARRAVQEGACDYDTITVRNADEQGELLVVAQRNELVDVPNLGPVSGLAEFSPGLEPERTCNCDASPDACCDGASPVRYQYEIGGEIILLGPKYALDYGGRSLRFWPFNAFSDGCEDSVDVAWALTPRAAPETAATTA